MKKLGVVGSGTMGFGIAFYFAIHDYATTLYDITEESLAKAKDKYAIYYDLFVAQGFPLVVTKEQGLANLHFTTSLEDFADCDLIIESVVEVLPIKQALFAKLDTIAKPDAILASNTSSFTLTAIMQEVEHHKTRTMLTHFFNPAQIVPLVELLGSEQTTPAVLQDVRTFFESIHKTPVYINKELPGLVANRIQVALARETLALVEDGVISKEDVEKVIYDGPGFRYATSGLLKIIDFGGLDVWDKVLSNLQPEVESGVRSFPMMKELVEQGAFGSKTGQGFFEYPGGTFDDLVLARDGELLTHLLATHYKEGK